ncbi:MAG: hypothetical protein HC828_13935, partial [Blastochloris sp.]|nr:hypothetical protein [Blastochloris sp.]
TLPFVSYGGSSLLVNFVVVGLLLRLSSGGKLVQFTREIDRLLAGLLVAFGIVVLAAAYWAIVGPDTLLAREDNPRLVERERAIARGALYDRQDRLLAESLPNEAGVMVRQYAEPLMNGAVGYFSYRYGTAGAEAAFNTILRGDTIPRDAGS